jgi:hypothetical protein
MWTFRYKKSINCKKPRGFSQKQHCRYGRKKSKSCKGVIVTVAGKKYCVGEKMIKKVNKKSKN